MRPRWPVRAPGQYVRRMGTERTETARCQMRGPCWPGSHWLRDAAWETRGPRWPGSRGPHGTAWEARWPRWPGSRAGWIGAGARVARSECNRPAHLGVDLGRRRSPREGNDACNPPPVTTPTRGLVAPIVVGVECMPGERGVQWSESCRASVPVHEGERVGCTITPRSRPACVLAARDQLSISSPVSRRQTRHVRHASGR